MELKPGYKQTEVGIFPEDWEINTFESYADRDVKWSLTGGPFGSNLKASEYTKEGVRIIQLQNIGDGKFYNDYKIFTSNKKADELKSCNIFPNEIILSKMGDPVARACFVPNEDQRYLMASDGIRLVVDEKKYNKRFVHDYINSKYFRNKAIDTSTGSTRLRIGLQELKKLPVIKPPLNEQTRIAQVLSDTDELISSLEKLIEKKRLIKQGTMQQLLTGKKRLPGFSGEWVTKKLGEIFIINAGGDLDKYNFSSIKDEVHCYPIYSNSLYEKGLYGYSPVYTQLENTITVTARGTVGVANYRDHKYSAIGRVLILYPLEKLSGLFISECINNLIDFANESTGVPQLTAPQIAKYEVTIPSFEEQNAIAEVLSDMDSEIETLEKKRDKYKAIKQGMMQELLTGKTRLI